MIDATAQTGCGTRYLFDRNRAINPTSNAAKKVAGSIDKDNEKVSLGLKQISVEPWRAIDDKFKVGDIIDGKVVQIKDYGVFVEIEPGMDGLVHISEMSYKHVASPSTEVQLGQVVKSKILDIDKENKRISLSIKEASEKPAELVEKEAAEKIEEAAE